MSKPRLKTIVINESVLRCLVKNQLIAQNETTEANGIAATDGCVGWLKKWSLETDAMTKEASESAVSSDDAASCAAEMAAACGAVGARSVAQRWADSSRASSCDSVVQRLSAPVADAVPQQPSPDVPMRRRSRQAAVAGKLALTRAGKQLFHLRRRTLRCRVDCPRWLRARHGCAKRRGWRCALNAQLQRRAAKRLPADCAAERLAASPLEHLSTDSYPSSPSSACAKARHPANALCQLTPQRPHWRLNEHTLSQHFLQSPSSTEESQACSVVSAERCAPNSHSVAFDDTLTDHTICDEVHLVQKPINAEAARTNRQACRRKARRRQRRHRANSWSCEAERWFQKAVTSEDMNGGAKFGQYAAYYGDVEFELSTLSEPTQSEFICSLPHAPAKKHFCRLPDETVLKFAFPADGRASAPSATALLTGRQLAACKSQLNAFTYTGPPSQLCTVTVFNA